MATTAKGTVRRRSSDVGCSNVASVLARPDRPAAGACVPVVGAADLPRARDVLLHEPDRLAPADRIIAIGFGIRRSRGSKLSKRDLELLTGGDGRSAGALARRRLPSLDGVGVIAGLAFARSCSAPPSRARSRIARSTSNTDYASIAGLPEGGVVRLVPKEVAVQIASSGFNSPTEQLTDFRSVLTPEGLPGPHSARPTARSGSSRRRARGSSP